MVQRPYSVLVPAAIRPPEYFAGAFDGEGCLTILRSNRSTGFYYAPRIGVEMANLPIIRAFAARFGGRVHLKKIPRHGRKQTWFWFRDRPADIRLVLDTIGPWLIEKAIQSDKMKEYLDAINSLGRKNVDHPHFYSTLRLLKRAA